MGKIMPFLILLFCFTVSAQVKNLADGKKLDEIEKQIKIIDAEIANKEIAIKELEVKFAPAHPTVKQAAQELRVLNRQLAALNVEKKELLNKEFVEKLPNNNIDLLKTIILQNLKIIELLEKLAFNK